MQMPKAYRNQNWYQALALFVEQLHFWNWQRFQWLQMFVVDQSMRFYLQKKGFFSEQDSATHILLSVEIQLVHQQRKKGRVDRAIDQIDV